MAHEKQREFFRKVKSMNPQFFTDVKVLDIGSLDINGSNRHAFEHPYSYIGVDLSEGKNVDVICPGHLYESGYQFDTVISSECFEHDMYYARTLQNMVKLTRPGGLLLFTCASTGRPEHGTLKTNPQDAPFLLSMGEKWANYYKNLTEDDIRAVIDINNTFSSYGFEYEPVSCDLYFWGIKNK
jgi:SAM-dependent methyltransferase